MTRHWLTALFVSALAASSVLLAGGQRTPSAATPAATTAAERAAAWRAHQQMAAASPFAPLPWRVLGPAHQGSRIEAIAVPAGSRNTIYVAPSDGNVWKTTNNGLTWTPIFDHESAFAVGDIAVAPSNADVVWVGTGVVQPRFAGYAYAGTGVFKSTDAGRTWTSMGLAETHHIGKVLIDGTRVGEVGDEVLRDRRHIATDGLVVPVVAINAFPQDHASEHEAIRRVAEEAGARVAVSTHFSDGGRGAVELARAGLVS